MLRTNLVVSRGLRAHFLGFVAVTAAVAFTTDIAEARHYRHSHAARHHRAESSEASYGPPFSEIIVDANSGATLSSNNPDASRHPASLTKIMTLYLLFERLDAGKIKLDSELPVSKHASEQDPTKLGLLPGQTIRVEDAIKGLVTRSANDAAVVIAEAIGGSEEDFAKLMTRKAHALGMSHTTYVNASGLPDDEQVTTARDQATLGRAIQDRFPRYYRYFSTVSFNFRGHSIANHNHLLGSVEGVDGIKTGYTRSSGFNLVTSIRRGNRHLVGVVMGGHSAGSRDAIMRNLLAENLEKGATHRTVAAITEHNSSEPSVEVASDEDAASTSASPSATPAPAAAPYAPASISPAAQRSAAVASLMSQARADASSLRSEARSEQPRTEPAPLTSGVIQTQPIATIPGSSEPMKPVRVKTVQIKAGQLRVASAGPAQPAPPVTSAISPRAGVAETSNAVVAKADAARTDLPAQPPGHGTGNGILGVLPASSVPASATSQTLAYAEPSPQPVTSPAKPEAVHTGWIVQVGALESESEARRRIEAARDHAHGLLNKADPFTETVVAKGDRTLYRARFAGLGRDQAEAVCRALKRSDISCMTVRN